MRHVEIAHALSPHDKAGEALGVGSGSVPLSEGLTQMAAWAKKHGPQEPSIFSGIEVTKNMPPPGSPSSPPAGPRPSRSATSAWRFGTFPIVMDFEVHHS
ncbi:hypothetical protein ACFQ08_01630 [Streptosporangium algeriense]|uniref:Uncharacterized protein n=1 Tax=Streptosporangium algeriense TaxID=1682748 RepID=A0ABW3DKD3_9ACTN